MNHLSEQSARSASGLVPAGADRASQPASGHAAPEGGPLAAPRSALRRRGLLAAGAAVAGSAIGAPLQALAQQADLAARQAQLLLPNPAAFQAAMTTFVGQATPQAEGLMLEVPTLADNPSAVPVRIRITLPITGQDWCEEVILLAERNPIPLACRLFFTPLAGTVEAAVRVRLAQSQTLHALARMKSGRVLAARQAVTVAASGCGM